MVEELKNICKEAVVVWFWYYPGIFMKGLRKTM
jgi:hypothetical protein